MTLAEAPGSDFRVVSLTAQGSERLRLLDLGFVPGTPIQRLRTGPLGDPVAYLVRGTVIALRIEQAQTVEVEVAA
jgi:ferrous iron transport protein A